MGDKILLENMKFYGFHGALPAETVLGQAFIVSIEIDCDIKKAAQDDDLSRTVNYAEVCRVVREIVEGEPCRLIETVAEKIATAVLALGAVAVEVTVKKPHPPIPVVLDFAGVRIVRRRLPVRAYLGLGSNMGDRATAIEGAIHALRSTPGIRVLRVAAVRETEPVGYVEQNKFLNTVVEIDTELNPRELLRVAQGIEQEAGRVPSFRFGPRTLDVDILLFGDVQVVQDDLIIPHPRLVEREFVLASLVELVPELVIPGENGTIAELYERTISKGTPHKCC